MIDNILCMYITLMSPILAGIINMIWCKSKILKGLVIPLDGNKKFIDRKINNHNIKEFSKFEEKVFLIMEYQL